MNGGGRMPAKVGYLVVDAADPEGNEFDIDVLPPG